MYLQNQTASERLETGMWHVSLPAEQLPVEKKWGFV